MKERFEIIVEVLRPCHCDEEREDQTTRGTNRIVRKGFSENVKFSSFGGSGAPSARKRG